MYAPCGLAHRSYVRPYGESRGWPHRERAQGACPCGVGCARQRGENGGDTDFDPRTHLLAGIGHNLDLHALAAEIVENELGAGGALGVNAARHGHDIARGLAVGKALCVWK